MWHACRRRCWVYRLTAVASMTTRRRGAAAAAPPGPWRMARPPPAREDAAAVDAALDSSSTRLTPFAPCSTSESAPRLFGSLDARADGARRSSPSRTRCGATPEHQRGRCRQRHRRRRSRTPAARLPTCAGAEPCRGAWPRAGAAPRRAEAPACTDAADVPRVEVRRHADVFGDCGSAHGRPSRHTELVQVRVSRAACCSRCSSKTSSITFAPTESLDY